MVYSARETANNVVQAWSKYRLKEWAVMTLAGIIFVSGYVLGTLNWRKGASRIFVVLDIVLGTAGFFYFCYKGLQIFAEAHDEILAAIYNTQGSVETGHSNQAFENNYVRPRSVAETLQVPRIQGDQNSFVDDPGHENNSYMEFYPYRGSTLALENQETSTRSSTEDVGRVPQSSESAPNLYLKPSHLRTDGARARASNMVQFDNSENLYGNLPSSRFSSCRDSTQSLGSLGDTVCHWRGTSGATSESSIAVSCRCQRPPALGSRASMHTFQRPVQQSDPMQHYEVPKKLSIDFAVMESPDPNRQLKPQAMRWKPLPMAPPPPREKFAVCPDRYGIGKPGLTESPLPSTVKARNQAHKARLGPLPGLKVSPLPYIDSPGDDRSFAGVENSSGLKKNQSQNDSQTGESCEETRLEDDPRRFANPPHPEHENGPDRLEQDRTADGQSLAEGCDSDNDSLVCEDQEAEPKTMTERLRAQCRENGSNEAERDSTLTPGSIYNYYLPPQHGLRCAADGSATFLPRPEQSLEASNAEEELGHLALSEQFAYADQSFHTPPHRPPRVETPLPAIDAYPSISRLAILQHRMSLPMGYHLRETPVSAGRRSLIPVARYASHPLPAKAQGPSRYLPSARKTSSSSSVECSPPKSSGSPAPKKRTTPPSRGRSTPSRGRLSRIPSLISRRSVTPL